MGTTYPRLGWSGLTLLACLSAGPYELAAQAAPAKASSQPVKLSAVLSAFLVDSGVRTRGLAWTTGSDLPVTWESAQPVPNPDQYARKQGLMLVKSGMFHGRIGEQEFEMTLQLSGVAAGVARVSIGLPMQDVTREEIEKALKDEGMTLQPLKCSREKEGASFGNLIDAAKVPGKTASGLWWLWNCAHDGCTLSLTILYRRTDMAQVECFTG